MQSTSSSSMSSPTRTPANQFAFARSCLVLFASAIVSLTGSACDRGGNNSGGGGGGGGEAPESHQGRRVPLDCGDTCPTPMPSMGREARVVIQSVRYEGQPQITLKNGTSSAVSLEGWTVCQPPACQALSGSLRAGGTQTIDLTEITLANAGELAVFSSASASSSDLVAYVLWGEDYDAQMQSGAESRDLWFEDPTAGVCEGHGALVATGDVTRYLGWRSVRARCVR